MKISGILLGLMLPGLLMLPVAMAQDGVTVSNGVSCQPSSASGMIYTVTQIRNEASSNRTAYCVLSPENVASPSYSLFQIVLRNYGTVDRDVTCTAKVGQPYGGGYVTVSNVVTVPAGGEPVVNQFNDIERNNEYAVLGFNCVLPPKVALDVMAAWEAEPVPEA
ncbi:hypothetical protein [Arenimonas fontis]|uniref:Secreted protein n=1 Tax=Arenimonas fontis TaxID=2608255 RepID=A0A5B2ZE67_9GAMM|nr:hypothetical protein [Arenimonas fontis]KAA2285362.1 hypothetical protein F0415_05455 [Arenimonas fontis]